MSVQGFMPDGATVAGIRADIAAYEAERAGAHRAVRWRVPVFLGVFVLVVAAIAYGFNALADPNEQWVSTPHVFLYVVALVAAFFVYGAATGPATRLQRSFRERIYPLAFGFVEGVRYTKGGTPESFGRLPAETVGAFNRSSFDDVVTGRYEGFPFELYEATLTQKTGKDSSTTVFRGVIVAFETVAPFPGKLIVTRKAMKVVGFFRGLFGSKFEEIASGVPDLDAAYEFRTDNAEAARPLVTGRLAQALKWLAETWPEGQARIALSGADGFLLLPLTKNFFELPGISQPIDYTVHIEPMVADMAALLATAALVRKAGGGGDQP